MSKLEFHAESLEGLNKLFEGVTIDNIPKWEMNLFSFRSLHIRLRNELTNTILANVTGFLYKYNNYIY